MLANGSDGTVRIDLAGGISAIGGLFGDSEDGPAGTGSISIFDGGGLVDTQPVSYGDMGAGLSKTFFGRTSTDTVFTALEFSIAQNGSWSTVDNVRFGTSVSEVPIPAALPLLLSALGFFGLVGWRRKRMVAA